MESTEIQGKTGRRTTVKEEIQIWLMFLEKKKVHGGNFSISGLHTGTGDSLVQ